MTVVLRRHGRIESRVLRVQVEKNSEMPNDTACPMLLNAAPTICGGAARGVDRLGSRSPVNWNFITMNVVPLMLRVVRIVSTA
jgi:hypothetical protein